MQTKGLQGDLEYMSQGYGLEVAQSSTPCPWCSANASDIPWSDCRPCAQWRAHCYNNMTPELWKEQHPGACELFQVPGVTIATIKPDIMHIKHLGVDSYLLGSFFSFCCQQKLPQSEQQNMVHLWALIQTLYKDWGVTRSFSARVLWWASLLGR